MPVIGRACRAGHEGGETHAKYRDTPIRRQRVQSDRCHLFRRHARLQLREQSGQGPRQGRHRP
nr:hypothetical protein SHINE37_70209 [Rhizobiaceae bacterium]